MFKNKTAYETRHEKRPVFGVCNQLRLKLMGLARGLKFRLQPLEVLYYPGSEQQKRWSDCADAQADRSVWSAPLLFTYGINRFSHDMAHIIFVQAMDEVTKAYCSSGKMTRTHEPRHDKTNQISVRQAKTPISLGIRPVWSESSLSAWRKLGYIATH